MLGNFRKKNNQRQSISFCVERTAPRASGPMSKVFPSQPIVTSQAALDYRSEPSPTPQTLPMHPIQKDERSFHRHCSNSTKPVAVGDVVIGGGGALAFVSGPSFVETPAQMVAIGTMLQQMNSRFIRSRAFRQDTWLHDFQGLGLPGLKILRAAADTFGLKVISEITDLRHLKDMLRYCDVIEVGPRNSHNYSILRELSATHTTVLLQRGPLMTVKDFISAARILERGQCCKILLAENGIRACDPRLKDLLDVSSIITLQKETPHPVLVDCSQAASHWTYVESLAIVAVSAGADGVLVDTHPTPRESSVDTKKVLLPDQVKGLQRRLEAIRFTLHALMRDDVEKRCERERFIDDDLIPMRQLDEA